VAIASEISGHSQRGHTAATFFIPSFFLLHYLTRKFPENNEEGKMKKEGMRVGAPHNFQIVASLP
jgi:hypothetical protein